MSSNIYEVTTMENTMSIGVDLHKPQFTVCFMKPDGRCKTEVYFFKDDGIMKFRKELAKQKCAGWMLTLAVETTGNSEYFVSEIEDMVDEAKTLNTLRVKPLIKNHKKTDKHDAKAIAFLLGKGIFTKEFCVHIPSHDAKEMRVLLKTRNNLKRVKTATINQIHGVMLGIGVETKKRFLSSKKGRQELRESYHEHQSLVNLLLDQIDAFDAQLQEVDAAIAELTKEREADMEILQSIPGVGVLIASTLTASIDTITRFEDPSKLTSYFGLVPFVNNSSDEVRHGRITKNGPASVRTALVQAALSMTRRKDMQEHPLVKHYRYLKKHKCAGKAIIALARKIAKIAWVLLTRRETFDIERRYQRQIENANRKKVCCGY